MDRRIILKSLGLAGLGAAVNPRWVLGADRSSSAVQPAACFLSPAKDQGPFPSKSQLIRQDITSDTGTGAVKTGLPLDLAFTVVDINCIPISAVMVDIWHCEKDGVYSDYSGQIGGLDTTGQDFCRGIQPTDLDGTCTFKTIYPGWYPGRATHIHFKVWLNSTTYVTSQFAFPEATNNAVYATPLYSGHTGTRTMNTSDGILGNADADHLVITTTPNASTGGYDGAFTIGITVPTAVGDPPVEPGAFALEQNYPNPFNPMTRIRYHLDATRNVKLIVSNVLGRDVATLVDARQTAGAHDVVLDAGTLGSGFYYYRLVADGAVLKKEMLLLK